ncbi:ABC transporter ATP-binding protein [Paenisporosarcina cavernae]|uniref:sn-glycerol-3-phosphate ABC transporter ATP-binding protein UgpC n=1 Tax=Paenisporosarcina cavernae TaxID=2320858 RepID=A0A385YT07_9BACL|nr:sn-glycerol-3-phosphate ABC transporter ATP-binding protein UgpC [Paenisporosarcina cavernae]AYC28583.1 sn-glycerol-3-phosphate ABC transporter ATP-binding protein UgpC [Paenisporosarcina cavernae]
MASLVLDNISKVYDNKVTAVSNFHLQVEDEEFIVFVGPSGCGKSTTLRMIAGLEEISGGDFFVDGKRMNDVTPKERDIAMVFQNYALYPHMTVYENMAFGLKLRKVPKKEIDRRVNEAAAILGLESYLKRKPKALSGGQRQRVALGRAIVRDAKIFLMDEPLSNLDSKLRVQMRAEIAKLHQRLKTTTIYVTHDQTEAMTMASRIVIMKDGVVQQIGTPKEVYEEPTNVFVGGFIGSPAMNFFRGVYANGQFGMGETVLTIPTARQSVLKAYEGKEVILGIRPEHINNDFRTLESEQGMKIATTVDVAELTGAEQMVYATLEGQEFIGRIDSKNTVHPGDAIDLAFHLERAHFFDVDTEERIMTVE